MRIAYYAAGCEVDCVLRIADCVLRSRPCGGLRIIAYCVLRITHPTVRWIAYCVLRISYYATSHEVDCVMRIALRQQRQQRALRVRSR